MPQPASELAGLFHHRPSKLVSDGGPAKGTENCSGLTPPLMLAPATSPTCPTPHTWPATSPVQLKLAGSRNAEKAMEVANTAAGKTPVTLLPAAGESVSVNTASPVVVNCRMSPPATVEWAITGEMPLPGYAMLRSNVPPWPGACVLSAVST